jgi:DNA-directed RNA polymerase subunit beta'
MVCSAFNADFDGDQMGVHIPLTIEAQVEGRLLMMSVNNVLSPSNSKIVPAPSQDIVLGIYYLTKDRDGLTGEGKIFSDKYEALLAYENNVVDLHSKIKVRVNEGIVDTTPGRLIFSDIFPSVISLSEVNKTIKKKDLSKLIESCFERAGVREAVVLIDKIKEIGFKYATLSGISFCTDDIYVPKEKQEIITETDAIISSIKEEFQNGLITEQERHNKIVDVWIKANERITETMMNNYGIPDNKPLSDSQKKDAKEWNSVYIMDDSGARGSREQIRQLGGMRGLMAKPTGEIVEIPIKSNFKEGMSYHEFLLASHGARKGKTDQALKTANAGYFTRRLVDVAHDVIINEKDCGTIKGINISPLYDGDNLIIPLEERIYGRVLAEDLKSSTGEIIGERNDIIDKELVKKITDAGISTVNLRTPIHCELGSGVCAMCYGYDLSQRKLVSIGEAVGVIAGQSIGEPGTQLTLRTFHGGGGASRADMRSKIDAKKEGEARFKDIKYVKNKHGLIISINRNGRVLLNGKDTGAIPSGATIYIQDGQKINAGQKIADWDQFNIVIVTEVDGVVKYKDIIDELTIKKQVDHETGITRKIITNILSDKIPSIEIGDKQYALPIGSVIAVNEDDSVSTGDVIAKIPKKAAKTSDITGGISKVLQLLEARIISNPAVLAETEGEVTVSAPSGKTLTISITDPYGGKRQYTCSVERQLNYYSGDYVKAGDILVDGTIEARDLLKAMGGNAAAQYIIDEVQKVYRSHGVETNDKHLEIIVGKMLSMVKINDAGDTVFTAKEIVKKTRFLDINRQTEGKKAIASPILLGLTTVASLSESWLSAASFQRTSHVLANAAIKRKVDILNGLKENIIIGNTIPAGTGHEYYK